MKQEESGIGSGIDLNGLKIAQVIKTNDPKVQSRVLVRVLGVHELRYNNESEDAIGDLGIWANCCSPSRSSPDRPQEGDFVYVMFPNPSDPMHVVWMGFVIGTVQKRRVDVTTGEQQGKVKHKPMEKKNV